jgi:hypothetical protein
MRSTDLSWEEDEPATEVAEEEAAPPAEESAPAPQAEPETLTAEATLPKPASLKVSTLLRLKYPHRVIVVVRYDRCTCFLVDRC